MDQIESGKPVKPTASTGFMERAMGIEQIQPAKKGITALFQFWTVRRNVGTEARTINPRMVNPTQPITNPIKGSSIVLER
jgi:hypothetical protein